MAGLALEEMGALAARSGALQPGAVSGRSGRRGSSHWGEESSDGWQLEPSTSPLNAGWSLPREPT